LRSPPPSAVFAAVAAGLSLGFLHERLVANLWAGVAQVMEGLLLLGLG
jgi:hypothetical protein